MSNTPPVSIPPPMMNTPPTGVPPPLSTAPPPAYCYTAPPAMMLPPNANKTIFLNNIPNDATVRELAHIFRPYPGYIQVRIIPKEKNGKKFNLCFVDFDNEFNSTRAKNALNGYLFDGKNNIHMGIEFAKGVNNTRPNRK